MKIESPAITIERRWIARWFSLIGKVVLFCGLVLAGHEQHVSPATVGFLSLFGPSLIAMSYLAMITRPLREGSVEVQDGVVTIRGRRSLRRIRLRDIASAYVVSRPHHGRPTPSVEIHTRRGTIMRAVVSDEASAHALVEAMGFGPGGRAVRIDLARRARRLLHPLLGVLSSVIGFYAGALIAGLMAALLGGGMISGGWLLAPCYVGVALAYALLKRSFAAPVVTVGSDGIGVRRGLENHRIPRWDVTGIAAPRPGGPLVIERQKTENYSLHGVLVDHALLDTVAVETERRFRIEGSHPRAAAFERGGETRDVGAWKNALRGTLDAGYRSAGTTVEDANAVLASTGSTTEQRLGAALALRVAGEPPERIRIAADGMVDPKLRVAFEAIAEDDDEKIEKALRRLTP